MKTSQWIAAALVAGIGSFSANAATTYLSDFSSLAAGAPLDGVDGWTQSEPNFEDEDFVYPRAFGATIGTGPAAAVGGYYDTFEPDSPPFYASRTVERLANGTTMTMNLAIVDSDSFGEDRNTFTVGLHGPSGNVFSLVFSPAAQSADPGGDTDAVWNVSWSSGSFVSVSEMAILETQLYGLEVNLFSVGADLGFEFSLSALNTVTRSGTIAGLAGADITELQVGFSTGEITEGLGSSLGSNFIAFNDVAVVPEPSVFLMSCVSLVGWMARRRRPQAIPAA